MNYYNEFDPKAAAWLRELIKQNLIPNGHVDERSIVDVRGADLAGYTQCHFFAGIGGWPLAAPRGGVHQGKHRGDKSYKRTINDKLRQNQRGCSPARRRTPV